MRVSFKRYLVFISVLVFLVGLGYSQSPTTGAIEGKVTDEQGTPLPGAQVKISSPDLMGGTLNKVTTAEGKFRFVAIPRGTYVVEASLAGFVTTKKEDVRVFVGETIAVDLALRIGKLEEEVTVKATIPVIDVKDTQMNATNMDRQMLQTVVAETNDVRTTTLVNLAPGVVDRSFMGAGQRTGIQINMDGQGVLTYIGAGGDWQYPDRDILEEVKISGSGSNAEYGSFTGGVINMITKSGGNVWDGLVSLSYSPLSFSVDNVNSSDPIFSLYHAAPRKYYLDAHIGIGGPIIKDKLWFYGSGGFLQTDDEIAGYTGDQKVVLGRESTRIPKGFLKFTFQPDKNNRFSAYTEYEDFLVYNRGLSVDRPTDATYFDVGPGWPIAVNWLHTFTENTFLEAKAGMYIGPYHQRPNHGKDVPERYDWLTGMYSGNWYYWKDSKSQHYTANVTLTHHADKFIKGSHDFKVGVEYLNGFHESKYGYTGGFRYTDNYPYSYVTYEYRYVTVRYSYSYNLNDRGWRFSAFAQDSWTISDRLTINPGIRWQMQRGYMPNLITMRGASSDLFFKPKSPVEARIGLTFDVFGDHTTALKLHYGRFHDNFKTFYFNPADPGINDLVEEELAPDGTWVEIWRKRIGSWPTTCDPNIRIPYSDQYTAGLERTVMKDASVGLTFVYREYKDFIARVNMSDTWYLSPWEFYNYDIGDYQTIDVYRRTAGSEDQYMITNPKKDMSDAVLVTPKNTYKAVTFTFNKRFSDGWMFHVDYTYSQTKGNHTNNRGGSSWGGTYYENPNRQINAYGFLPYDAPHTLHIWGTISLPYGIMLSPRFLVQTGCNWTKYARGSGSFGSPDIFIEARGSERVPALVTLDFRLEKMFQFSGKRKLGVFLDAYNVFNQGVPTYIYGNVRSEGTFGKADTVCSPLFFRIGTRFYF